jgi:hypothetical protein
MEAESARDLENQAPEEQQGTAGTGLKVTIRSWSGVAVWKWLANDDTCGICR